MSRILAFEDFLTEAEITEYVTVQVGKGEVRLASIRADVFVEFTTMRSDDQRRRLAGSYLINASLVDEQGAPIGDAKQLERISKINLKTSEALLKAIFKLNNINQPEELARQVAAEREGKKD